MLEKEFEDNFLEEKKDYDFKCKKDDCGEICKNNEFCKDCMSKLERVNGISFTHSSELNDIISVVYYNNTAKKAVHRFKFKNHPASARAFGKLMAEEILKKDYLKPDFLVPVPLYKKRQAERGFNQSELLAANIAKILEIPTLKMLKKIRETPAQSTLNAENRIHNLDNTFSAVHTDKIKESNILLVDDVYTTGSTLSLCAKELLNAGAKRVDAVTFALSYKNF